MRRVLEFLRFVDPHDGQLSLTNIALMIVLWKLASSQAASSVDVGGLLVALASYSAKKMINRGAGGDGDTP